jgi:5-methylthioadenosine/S-adenosylhomocysteine deaminase
MKIATGGYAPVPELLMADVSVGLGTDGAASNNILDMFDTMKMTALVHKQHRWDPQVMSAQTVLNCATIGGSQVLGKNDHIGSIEEGKNADIICIDVHSPHLTPCHDPVSNIVYAASGSDVCTTIVDGKVLYHDRKFLTLPYEEILEKANKKAKDLTSDL